MTTLRLAAVSYCFNSNLIGIDGWMNGQIDGWMDGWIDGWMDRWMDGWMDVLDISICRNLY